MWLARSGVKPGQVIGRTDQPGFPVVADKVHVPGLRATILYCLGFDRTCLACRHMRHRFRLTGLSTDAVQHRLV